MIDRQESDDERIATLGRIFGPELATRYRDPARQVGNPWLAETRAAFGLGNDCVGNLQLGCARRRLAAEVFLVICRKPLSADRSDVPFSVSPVAAWKKYSP
jgi:hypothetical protein